MFGLGDPYEDASKGGGSDAAGDGKSLDGLDDGTHASWTRIAYFPFDNGINDSTGMYIGVDMGNISEPPGHKNNALGLDGASCVEVSIPAQPATYTIAFWAKPAGTNGGVLVSRAVSSVSTKHSYQVYESSVNGGFGFLQFDGTAEIDGVSPSAFADNTFRHYAVTFDGTTKIWYVDGAPATSQAATAISYGPLANISIGCQDGATRYFTGLIDELYFFDGVLSQADIVAVANQ